MKLDEIRCGFMAPGQACLPCNLFVEEILQPLELRVTALVYGCEVDYAVVAPGELPPEIRHQPRGPTDPACDPLGSSMRLGGRASDLRWRCRDMNVAHRSLHNAADGHS